jgi:hypothetical protein
MLLLLPVAFAASNQAGSKAEPERFALLVGVDAYAKPAPGQEKVDALIGPGEDLRLMSDLLTSPAYRFKDDGIHIKRLQGALATHLAIKQTFKSQLIDNAARYPGAIVVFYFSGHGSQANNVAPGDTIQHDTLLAYDSRAGAGDILDNELIDWFEQLRAYTNNATFILDSCHSGSAIKGPDRVARIAPPNPKQSSGAYLHRDVPPSKANTSIVPRRQQLVLLSGSKPDEASFECDTEDCAIPNGPTHYGFFTYYLTKELTVRPNETNDAAVQHVANALAKVSPYQTPNAVGNVEGIVLSGIGEREDPFIKIQALPNGNELQILAGAPVGLRKGTFLAIYSASTTRLVGEDGKLANARVTEVGSTVSTAVLSENPKRALTLDDKVAVVTPFFGFEALRVRLPNSSSAADLKLLAKLKPLLQADKLLRLVGDGDEYDLAIQVGCVSGENLTVSSLLRTRPINCIEAFYVTAAHGDGPLSLQVPHEPQPLYLSSISPTDPQAAEVLSRNLEMRAKQQNVRALDNAQSPFSGKLKLRWIKVVVHGNEVIPSDPVNNGYQEMHVGESFRVQIENQSTQDLYVALYVLGSSGTVTLLTVDPHGDFLGARDKYVTYVPWDIGLPLGRETYKAFASTSKNVDWRHLEVPGQRGVEGCTPLECVLNQTTNTTARDPTLSHNLNLNEWTTAYIDIEIKPKIN